MSLPSLISQSPYCEASVGAFVKHSELSHPSSGHLLSKCFGSGPSSVSPSPYHGDVIFVWFYMNPKAQTDLRFLTLPHAIFLSIPART